MLYLMKAELYNKLQKVNKFKQLNGSTYQEYILKSVNLPNLLRCSILYTKTPDESLNILKKNQIDFTHNYLESIVVDDSNIKLTIIDKDVYMVN